MKRSRTAALLAVAAVVVLIVILVITLTPTPVDRPYGVLVNHIVASVQSFPGLRWFTYEWLERIANVIMFVPLAAVVTRALGARWWLAVIGGCALLSGLVEGYQLLFLPERTASVIDVIANTAGATVGAGIVVLHGRRTTK